MSTKNTLNTAAATLLQGFAGDPYEMIQFASQATKELHGKPETRSSCEVLQDLISELSFACLKGEGDLPQQIATALEELSYTHDAAQIAAAAQEAGEALSRKPGLPAATITRNREYSRALEAAARILTTATKTAA